MKTIGVIGGIAPESTIAYYRLIIARYRERKGDGNYPPIIINSINMTYMLDLVSTKQFGALAEYMAREIRKLAHAGADFGLMSSNTPHIVFDDIRRQSSLPLISIVEAAAEAAQAQALKKVGLFGTRFTMQGGTYTSVFTRAGIQVITPEPDDQTYIHDKYMGEWVHGVFLPETRARLLAIVDRLREAQGIEGLILGGTEIPLILTEPEYQGLPFLDTTRIHVEKAVTELLA